MRSGGNLSRRTLLHLLLGGLCVPRYLAALPQRGIPAAWKDFSPNIRFCRQYRIDATVLVLGVPLISRQNVGGACASVEIGGSSACNAVALQFAAGSWPERARGLNRFGIWREAVLERAGEPAEIAFSGLITHSPEQTLADARTAFTSNPSRPEAIVARGNISGGTMQTWVDRVQLSPGCVWTGAGPALCEVSRQAPGGPVRETEGGGAVTFLYAMRAAALGSARESRTRFLQNDKLYLLETRRNPERPLTISGIIRDARGARCSDFRVAYEQGDESGLPVRIEFRPRSFLRLTFEADGQAIQPPAPCAMEENA
jgi:hypothetical protein